MSAEPAQAEDPNDDPYVRRAEFGRVGLVTYVINDAQQAVTLVDVTWTG